MKNLLNAVLWAVLITGIFYACQKDSQAIRPDPSIKPDLSVTVTASLAGFITNEADVPMKGASVTAGGATTTTDEYGFFSFNDVSLSKVAGHVKVVKAGYFNGYRTFVANEAKESFVRLQMIPKKEIGTLSANAGGKLSTADGATVEIAANAVANATSGAAYTGTVHMAAHWLNPTDMATLQTMPGDLRAIDKDGYMKGLATYGMMNVELTDDAGQRLQLATGKEATLNMPIPASMISKAPLTIALWSFDESTGLWKEEGSAIKQGQSYVGKVTHFSTWNCDVSIPLVPFTVRIVDKNNQPMGNFNIAVYCADLADGSCHGITDTGGWINAYVPANKSLLLKVYTNCNTSIDVASFTSGNSPVDLKTVAITADLTAYATALVGTVVDCNNHPVQNGYVFVIGTNVLQRLPVNNGFFNYNTLICNHDNLTVQVLAVDNGQAVQGLPKQVTIHSGVNNAGVLIACGVSTNKFLNYTIDGQSLYYNKENSLVAGYTGSNETNFQANINASSDNVVYFVVHGNASTSDDHWLSFISAYPFFPIQNFHPPFRSIKVTLTEYGGVLGFIAGSFSGTLNDALNVPHNVSCDFRIQRTQ